MPGLYQRLAQEDLEILSLKTLEGINDDNEEITITVDVVTFSGEVVEIE